MRVLLVDDDPAIRSVLARLVERDGHTTCWASSGEGALKLLHSERGTIDAIILDINLGGGLSGYEVARHLPRGLPLVVLSGMSPDDVRQGAKAMTNALEHALTILGKPIDAQALRRTLSRIDEERKVKP